MGKLTEYLLSGRLAELPDEELERLAARWEWFSVPRRLLAARRGADDPRAALAAAGRAPFGTEAPSVDAELLTTVSAEELIDRFLQEEDLRIVAGEGEPESEVRTEAELDDEDDMVSEELAEIYLAQGFRDRAAATYRKLSLRNPEKSVYFAEIIDKIESNN